MITKKALAATFKDIGTTLYTIGARLALELLRKYSIAKANYFYNKVKKNVEEQFAEINRMIEVNNVTAGRRIAVAATHLRDTAAD